MFNTNNSQYDIGITFTFATAARLEFVDSSLPILEAYYTILLGPKFVKHKNDISSAMFDPAVLYILCVIILSTIVSAVIYFLAEMTTTSSPLYEIKSYSGRLGQCFMIAVDNLLSVATVMELTSPVSILLRAIASYASLFLVTIFIAIITSRLTAATLHSSATTLQDIAGARIAVQGLLMRPFLQSPQTNAVAVVYDTLDPAVAGFYGANPDRLDGFAGQPEIVDYYRRLYGANSSDPYVVLDPFTLTGSPEPRGYLLSKGLDRAVANRFNAGLQALRQEGRIAELMERDVPAGEPEAPAADISIDAGAVYVVRIVCIAAAATYFVVSPYTI
jgi:ABC-type amino acid transport substrate-binding protein